MPGDAPVLLVTGGASGIGAACAERFARGGYRVLFGDLQDEKGLALAAALGGDTAYTHLAVKDEASMAAAVAAAVQRFGRLDCLINNAAIVGVIGPVTETSVE